MKNHKTALIFCLLMLFTILFTTHISAQDVPPPPPPPSGGHGSGGSLPPGGGSAIGEGMLILIALGAGFAAKKWRAGGKATR